MRPDRTELLPEGATSNAPLEEADRALRCRVCEVEITDHRALFCMRAQTVEQVFPNPYGHMRVILTAKEARSVIAEGEGTTEFTWFAGYAWRVLYCASCRAHLGWLFEAAGADDGDSPARFYGLLREALVER
jgi:hypothetical protein